MKIKNQELSNIYAPLCGLLSKFLTHPQLSASPSASSPASILAKSLLRVSDEKTLSLMIRTLMDDTFQKPEGLISISIITPHFLLFLVP